MDDFTNIKPEDIMFQNKDVSILKPNIPKGILISSRYPADKYNILQEGLKSGAQLKKENKYCHTKTYYNCIFFRAPYQKPKKLDYSSVELEILNLYSQDTNSRDIQNDNVKKLEDNFMDNRIFIRVDPNKTFVYSSELRDIFTYPELYQKKDYIINSRKTMIEYLNIIEENRIAMLASKSQLPYFNLLTSRIHFTNNFEAQFIKKLPYSPYLINKCSEVLVELPILSPCHFVNI